jgi:hypothetical protein
MATLYHYFDWSTDQLPKEAEMPLITVKLIEGVFDAEEKHEMIE